MPVAELFVQKLVNNITDCAENYAKTVEAEMRLEDERAIVKIAAIQRIMRAGDNLMTSKPHSYSSAEAVVNTDVNYADYLGKLREAAVRRILARGKYDAAIAESRLTAATE